VVEVLSEVLVSNPVTVTLTDVARAAGVSPSTVSRILNGTAMVNEIKRQRVLEVIDRLGYRPNIMAQSLKTGQSMSIGVLTQELDSLFYGKTLKGIEMGLADSQYHPLFVGGHWREQDELASLEVLNRRRIDALIVLGGLISAQQLLDQAKTMPVVVVSRIVAGLEAQCIDIDNQQAAFEATKHLLDLGHRRIAHITGPLLRQDAQERLAGYRMALKQAGIDIDERLVCEGDYNEQSGVLAMDVLLLRASRLTAVFAANDSMAHGARLTLFRRGIRVPEDISLIGFDDLPTARYSIPPLTTVRQPMLEMGQEAAELVLGLLEGGEVSAKKIKTELIVRESTTLLR
jgi:LacI family transcriptional regulator